MFLSETPQGLRGLINYSTDLFDEQSIASVVEHFMVLLHSIVQHPGIPIDQLEIHTATARERKLREHKARRHAIRQELKNIINSRAGGKQAQ